MTDISADRMVEFMPDSQDGRFPESNILDEPQEFSCLGWTDSTGRLLPAFDFPVHRAKDLGATVPSYNKFRQTQDMLLAEVGDPNKCQESGWGNVWYLNQFGDSIKKAQIVSQDGSLLVQDQSLEVVEVSSFESNFLQILDCTSGIYPLTAASDKFAAEMPHPLREKAGSRMGYIQFRSPSSSTMYQAINLNNGAKKIHATCQMVELGSSTGLNTNFFCQTCQAGGTREWKQSNKGFPEVLKAGEMRNLAETAEETVKQIVMALEPNIATILTETVCLSGVKDVFLQPIIDILVKMGQDLQKANPEGSLYSPDEIQTILTEELKKHQQRDEGITNPLFDMAVWVIEKGKDSPPFQTCLNSILSDGLNIPKVQADYMCQCKGGLIRKHFKTLSRIMAFAVEGLVPPDVLEAWLILGHITVLLWHAEIEDGTSYTAELEMCINDFINITCKCSGLRDFAAAVTLPHAAAILAALSGNLICGTC
ncbi:hypothetical protein DFH09DRAFT_1093532 [Mycena vulgaris]|nr:hypothetical protein DFH09DRAFT_1093532 [Mycena vulgaris]